MHQTGCVLCLTALDKMRQTFLLCKKRAESSFSKYEHNIRNCMKHWLFYIKNKVILLVDKMYLAIKSIFYIVNITFMQFVEGNYALFDISGHLELPLQSYFVRVIIISACWTLSLVVHCWSLQTPMEISLF